MGGLTSDFKIYSYWDFHIWLLLLMSPSKIRLLCLNNLIIYKKSMEWGKNPGHNHILVLDVL